MFSDAEEHSGTGTDGSTPWFPKRRRSGGGQSVITTCSVHHGPSNKYCHGSTFSGPSTRNVKAFFPKSIQRNTRKDPTRNPQEFLKEAKKTEFHKNRRKNKSHARVSRHAPSPETQNAQGVPESHVLPSASEQDVMFLGAILRSWDVLFSSCSRVPAKDSLVVRGVHSQVFVLPRLVEVASSPCWFAACFKKLARTLAGLLRFSRTVRCSCKFLVGCSVKDGSVCFGIDTGQEHERTIMNI